MIGLRFLSELPIERPWHVLLATAVVTVLLALGAVRVQIDATIDQMLVPGDSDHETFERLKLEFGGDEKLLVAVDFGDALTPEALESQRSLVTGLLQQTYVEDVDALVAADDIVGTQDSLTVRALVPSQDELKEITAQQATQIRLRVDANPIWTGTLVSADRSVAAIHVDLGPAPSPELSQLLVADVARLLGPHPAYFAGHPFMKAEIASTMQRDLAVFLPAATVVMLLLLGVALRSTKLVLAVFGAVVFAAIWMISAMGWFGLPLTALSNTAPTILIALATAYFMHLAVAYQRLCVHSPSSHEATRRALAEVRHPTIVAGATTGIGFASLSMSSVPMIAGFGSALAIGIVSVVLVACFPLPALIVVLEPSGVAPSRGGERLVDRMLVAISSFTARNDRYLLAATIVVLAASAALIARIEVDSSGPRAFPAESTFARSSDFYQTRVAGDVVENVYIDLGSTDAFKEPGHLAALRALQRDLEARPEIAKTVSIADYVGKMNRVLHGDEPQADTIPHTRAAVAQYLLLYSLSGDLSDFDELVAPSYSHARVVAYATVESSTESKRLRSEMESLVARYFPNADTAVVSTEVLLSKAADALVVEQVQSFAVALLLILILVAAAFRAPARAALLLLPNLVPIAITLGALSSLGVPLNQSTAVIGVVALGIAVDGTVHLLSAAMRSQRVHGNRDAAVVLAILTAGRPIVLTGAVVAIGFGVLALSQFRIVAELGATIAVTMMLCALADLVVLPAQLFGFARTKHPAADAVTVTISDTVYAGILAESAREHSVCRLVGCESSWRGDAFDSAKVLKVRSGEHLAMIRTRTLDVSTPVFEFRESS